MRFSNIIIASIIVLFCSCNKEKLKSPTASFILVNNPVVETTSSQGSNSNNISDIWLYVNDNFQGIYPIGKIMPIMAEKTANITMFAGIKNNGIAATRLPYPFYDNYRFTHELVPGETKVIVPKFKYLSGCVFPINDAFDVGGSQFFSVGDSAYTITFDPTKTFGGTGGSVFMSMSDAKPSARMKSGLPMGLPTGGAAVYLEMNYKCNQQITVGVIGGSTDERSILTLRATDEWKKIYVSLTNGISNQPTYSFYDVYIDARKEVDRPEIFIDNVKLVIQL
jgi:hypothetical protein